MLHMGVQSVRCTESYGINDMGWGYARAPSSYSTSTQHQNRFTQYRNLHIRYRAGATPVPHSHKLESINTKLETPYLIQYRILNRESN